MRLRRRRYPEMPLEFEPLARYNAEVWRGVLHTDDWKRQMSVLQERFNEWTTRVYGPDGTQRHG